MKTTLLPALIAVSMAAVASSSEEAAVQGTVQALRSSWVNAEVIGNVSEILVEEGRRVEEGEVLCRLSSAVQQANYDLARLQAEDETALDAARARLAQAERDLERAKTLGEGLAGSAVEVERARYNYEIAAIEVDAKERELEQLRRVAALRKATLDQYTILAPFCGIVAKKFIEVGETTYPLDKRLFHVMDISKVYVEAHPPISQLRNVRKGMEVTVKARAVADRTFTGEVTFIAPSADPGGRTFGIRAIVDNSEGLLMPEMKTDVYFRAADTAETDE